MKLFGILSVLVFGLMIVSFNPTDLKPDQKTDSKINCDSIPDLNKKIIDFVTSSLNKKVGKGECWDLAAEALNSAGAKWNGQYVYGSVVHYQSDCVYPGDIMQFKGVRIKYLVNNRIYDETMDQHTAIIYEVKGKGDYILAHQNTAFSDRKVGLSELKSENITRGKFTIYRPEK